MSENEQLTRYLYSLVRCVPEPRTGEFINIGAIAGSEQLGDWSARQVTNLSRATKLGATDGALQAATGFFVRAWEIINENDVALDAGREAPLSEAWLRECHRDLRNVVQLTDPLPVIAASADGALDIVFGSLVSEPTRQTRGLTKPKILSFLFDAFQRIILDATLYRRADLFIGDKIHTSIDIAATSRNSMVLTQAWSFQNARPEEVTDSIKAWGFAVSRLRENDGARLMTGTGPTSIGVAENVQLNVVVAEPISPAQRSAYEEAAEVFNRVGATVYPYPRADEVAERTRELLAA